MVDQFSIEELQKDQILPISGTKNSPVFIILTGQVILRDHLLNDPHDFKIAKVATAGSVLGVAHLDCGVSCKSTVWSIVSTKICVVVKMTRKTFEQLWKASVSRDEEITKMVLS